MVLLVLRKVLYTQISIVCFVQLIFKIAWYTEISKVIIWFSFSYLINSFSLTNYLMGIVRHTS